MDRLEAIRTSTASEELDGVLWAVKIGVTDPFTPDEQEAFALRRIEIERRDTGWRK